MEDKTFTLNELKEGADDAARLQKSFREFSKAFIKQQFVGVADGGLVKAIIGGNYKTKSFYLDPSIDSYDLISISSLMTEAINSAIDYLEETKYSQSIMLARQLGLPVDQFIEMVMGPDESQKRRGTL